MVELTPEKKAELTQDFKKYERYIYSILNTNSHRTRTTNPKVNIYKAESLSMTYEDLVQQGRLFLWEALLNYGKFPVRAKSVDRKIASKSTFVFTHIKNMFINLGVKSVCKKYKGKNVEIESSFHIQDTRSPDDEMMLQEMEKVLDTSKKFKRKDPEKYKQILTDYWKEGVANV